MGIRAIRSWEKEKVPGECLMSQDGLQGHAEFKPTSLMFLSKHLPSPHPRKKLFLYALNILALQKTLGLLLKVVEI